MFTQKLILTINNSIGNKKNHFNYIDVCKLFNPSKKTFNDFEKYAIETIQTEASSNEINNFTKKYNIPKANINHVLSINPY